MNSVLHNYKKWLLYGSLLSTLGFTISGTNPRTEGQISLSAESPPAAAAAPERAAPAVKTITPPSAASTSPSPTPAIALPSTSAASKVQNKGQTINASNGKNEILYKTLQRDILKNRYDIRILEDETNGSFAIYRPVDTEGKTCEGCEKTYSTIPLDSQTKGNIDAIVNSIEQDLITRKKIESTKTTTKEEPPKKKAADGADDVVEEDTSASDRLLESINTACDKSDKEAARQIECKVNKYITLLNRRLDKSKDKNKVVIDDDKALDFFNDNIKEGLKDMLTHKFVMPMVYNNDVYDRYSMNMEFNEEKATAKKEQEKAISLIFKLMKELGSKYKNVKKEIAELHKDATREQAKDALLNYTQLKLAEKNKDKLGMASNYGSFVMNDEFLRSLDQNLFSDLSSGINDARRLKLLDNGSYDDIMRQLNNSHSGLCLSYSRAIGQNSDSCGSLQGASLSDYSVSDIVYEVTNRLRQNARGNSSGSPAAIQSAPVSNGRGSPRGQ
jgi:hypothetical protein